MPAPPQRRSPDCPHCGKPLPLCICDSITPIESRISLLILQHPQEQDRALGTARLTALHFKDAVLKIGLSWPSLSKALGRPVARSLALGGALSRLGQGRRSRYRPRDRRDQPQGRDRGRISAPSSSDIEGIVLLDGTWSQAKALWWRNAWMLKCQRVILGPKRPRATASSARSRAATACPPSRPRRCCWPASRSGRISRRR